MLKYLIPFLSAFFLTIILIEGFIWIAKKIRWQGRNSLRHIHRRNASRVGGLAMILAFNAIIFLNKDLVLTPEIYGFMLGAIVLLAIGFWDDVKEIYWKIQLFFQISLAILVFILGIRIYYITNPLTGGIINLDNGIGVIFSIGLVIFWILTIMNAINWLDGIDGTAGGVS
ncbi:MAG TPA: undecaprenyl/decaprenyl-phosphate alpha-N-acetylglucosaminyl 1-phosphate transferase, partial [Candidatus Moranbacteria bacterium]|nr:undecaprenyl/decaprenyl-phosphate alpha-N-acetylglucosaminyl 1-phosphate transferase [Candidatus Moranbacteria bacterium]